MRHPAGVQEREHTMSIEDDAHLWLRGLLARSGFTRGDRRPLYALRCGEGAWREAQALLRGFVAGGAPVTSLRGAPAALFCLYASEWWRRHHEGGPWKWETMFDGLGLTPPATQALYPLVRAGMGWWGRDLLHTERGTEYLVTLACEGGLPLRLVQRKGNALRGYFRALLEEFRFQRGAVATPEELAGRAAAQLPRSLQHREVYRLCGALVEGIWARQHGLDPARDPIAQLDAREPGWQDELPLRLDEDVARSFLRGLVRDAIEVARTPRAPLRVETRLDRRDGRWHLRRDVNLPSEVSAVQVAELFQVDIARLPARFNLMGCCGEGHRLLLAFATRRGAGDCARYILEGDGRGRVSWCDDEALGEVTVHAVAPGLGTLAASLPGGEELTEVPWALMFDDENHARLVGTASARVHDEVALVVVPPWATLTAAAEAAVEPAGTLTAGGERAVVRVAGAAEITHGDDRYVVRTGHAGAREDVTLLGRTLALGATDARVFVGFPRVKVAAEAGVLRDVPNDQIEWRSAAGGAWRRDTARCRGVVVVRQVVRGEVRFRARCAVLPTGFEVRYLDAPGTRSVEFRGLDGARVGVGTSPAPAVELREDACTLSFGEDCSPGRFELRLTWDDSAAVRLELPTPVVGGRFLRGGGRALERGEGIHIDQLGGTSVEVLAPPSAGAFVMIIRTHANDCTAHEVSLRLVEEAPGVHRLPLGVLRREIARRLDASRDLDANVQLVVATRGGARRPETLAVRRYLGSLLPVEGGVALAPEVYARIAAGRARLTVEARPLWRPTEPGVPLEEVAPGRWRRPGETGEAGPYLALGRVGEDWALRPLQIQVGVRERASEAPCDLDAPAVTLAEAVRGAGVGRRSALDRVLDALAGDLRHPDWPALDGYLETLAWLPASTFDVIGRLVERPRACALALLRCPAERFETLWGALETSAFSWELVPFAAWRRALAVWADSWRVEVPVGVEALVLAAQNDAFGASLRRVAARSPSVALHLARAAVVCGLKLPDDEARAMDGVVQLPDFAEAQAATNIGPESDLRRELLRAHADDRWPQWTNFLAAEQNLRAQAPPWLTALLPDAAERHRRDVLAAPTVAAVAAVWGVRLDAAAIFELRQLRDFDPDWYVEAHRWTTVRAFARMITHAPERMR